MMNLSFDCAKTMADAISIHLEVLEAEFAVQFCRELGLDALKYG